MLQDIPTYVGYIQYDIMILLSIRKILQDIFPPFIIKTMNRFIDIKHHNWQPSTVAL